MTDIETNKLLKEILRWMKFQSYPQVKRIIEETLDTPVKKKIYELANGQNSLRKAAELAGGIDFKRVHRCWEEWARLGIIEKTEGAQPKFVKIISLAELGLDAGLEPIEEPAKEKTPEASQEQVTVPEKTTEESVTIDPK